MATTPTTYTGESASIYIGGSGHSTFALSDFSLTLSKGTVEQELLGESGNYFVAGSMSVEGSATACHMTTDGLGVLLESLLGSTTVKISGNIGANSLHFYFASCQVTSFDFSLGDGDTITEGSFDFIVLYPYLVSSVTQLGGGGTYIFDYAYT